jgi:hypothetical protein
MNASDLFKSIKKSFTVSRVVDFDDLDLHITLEPVTASEELKILEACMNFEGGAFMSELKRSSLAFSIKKINNYDIPNDFVEYPDEKGKIVKETKYIFLTKQIDSFPVALRDILFEAFNDLQLEIESIVSSKAKFERFHIQNVPEESKTETIGIPKGFKKVEESKTEPEIENETDRLNQQVNKEKEEVEASMYEALNKAETKR